MITRKDLLREIEALPIDRRKAIEAAYAEAIEAANKLAMELCDIGTPAIEHQRKDANLAFHVLDLMPLGMIPRAKGAK